VGVLGDGGDDVVADEGEDPEDHRRPERGEAALHFGRVEGGEVEAAVGGLRHQDREREGDDHGDLAEHRDDGAADREVDALVGDDDDRDRHQDDADRPGRHPRRVDAAVGEQVIEEEAEDDRLQDDRDDVEGDHDQPDEGAGAG
jgi:hypothetical protein